MVQSTIEIRGTSDNTDFGLSPLIRVISELLKISLAMDHFCNNLLNFILEILSIKVDFF